MALEHALLVSLTERSGSGYELARRFDKSIGFFWNATHQQIYRVLKRMEEAGWLDVESVAQEGRPDKKVYSVNAAGRAELARWIAEPSDSETPRSELGVKIRGAAYGDLDAVCAEVARHRDQHAHRLDVLRLIEKRDFPDPDRLTGTALHQYLVLRGGIRVAAGHVEWCEEVLQALRPPRTE
ncbi:transcriptional regulator, Acidobacterial, PadR-family [Nocardia farcinica]|uniref:Transcriptional regulator, Acidobacterial, PadR-family n=2 Tax=Nocardia farcinica TaxID=37329 RepID=A0A449H9M1_NOCFR|nr:PadR family transcriptional regulator [Nocardia farcinica]BAD56136.1 putative transcriptional regulator [Nocardia farcinica IFM 10152]VFA94628.1 transcriptional regulator, Acidobacterial, PadR-family [Nocardia farcinica]